MPEIVLSVAEAHALVAAAISASDTLPETSVSVADA
jgi:hypothetical protein